MIITTQIRSTVKYITKIHKTVRIFSMHNNQPQQNQKNDTTIYIQTQQYIYALEMINN
jgi:hypothetical protein